jgi:hypothetical protein
MSTTDDEMKDAALKWLTSVSEYWGTPLTTTFPGPLGVAEWGLRATTVNGLGMFLHSPDQPQPFLTSEYYLLLYNGDEITIPFTELAR